MLTKTVSAHQDSSLPPKIINLLSINNNLFDQLIQNKGRKPFNIISIMSREHVNITFYLMERIPVTEKLKQNSSRKCETKLLLRGPRKLPISFLTERSGM